MKRAVFVDLAVFKDYNEDCSIENEDLLRLYWKMKRTKDMNYMLFFLSCKNGRNELFYYNDHKILQKKFNYGKIRWSDIEKFSSEKISSDASYLITKRQSLERIFGKKIKIFGLAEKKYSAEQIVEKLIKEECNGKVVSLKELMRILKSLKTKKIGFTNGCFDIIHAGHVDYLKKAKEQVDILIVGLNSDSSVKKIKGEERPINNEYWRAKVLSAISFVDYIVIFKEKDATNLVKRIKPDVYFKGGDWKGKKLPEAEIVRKYGGKIVLLPTVHQISTSMIIKRILRTKE